MRKSRSHRVVSGEAEEIERTRGRKLSFSGCPGRKTTARVAASCWI